MTEILLGLRVVGFSLSLRYFREPCANPGNEKCRYNRGRVTNILKEKRIRVCVHGLAQGKGQLFSKDVIHGRRILDGKAFKPGREAVSSMGA